MMKRLLSKRTNSGAQLLMKKLIETKAKCIIKIVPQEEKCKTLQIDKKCIKTRD